MSPSSKQILIVGNSSQDEAIYRQALKGYHLIFILTAEQALDRVTKELFDLVIIHQNLPSKSGLELLQEINAATQSKLPTVLILEAGQAKIAVAAMKAGVSDCITREEFIPTILSMVISRAIEHKKWEKIYLSLASNESTPTLKDPVTELYTKGYLETRLREETTRAKRYQFPLTMVFFSLEQFAHINEHYGVNSGNELLKKMGQLLTRNLRPSDLLARIRDDKFILLLPHTSTDQAQIVWERLLGEIARHPFVVGEDNFYVTMRGALLSLNHEIETVDMLINQTEAWLDQNSSDANLTSLSGSSN